MPHNENSFAVKSRWVFPVDRPPIENGLVQVVDGMISDVRAARPADVADDLGDVAILPGLVNVHAHLEFSLIEQPLQPARPFPDWIRSLMAYRQQTFGADSAAKLAAFQAGWCESAASGTMLLGEIATESWSASGFAGMGPRVVPFRELIGLQPETIARQMDVAEAFLNGRIGNPTDGLSPHAPYSVAPELLRRVVDLARRHTVPLAMHVAETSAELELLSSGTGELVEMLREFGAWPDEGLPTGRRPLDVLRVLADAPRALIVHGNYLSDDEQSFLASRPNLTVVYCPRTHAFFDHEPHPWRRLMAQGANVALGTDGRGSNPDLSLWQELVFLRGQFADVSPRTLLELGTLAGARALGLDHDCGSLTPGKRADLAVASVAGMTATTDPHELLFVPGQRIVRTYWERIEPRP